MKKMVYEEKSYLVERYVKDQLIGTQLMTAAGIIARIGAAECKDERLYVYDLTKEGKKRRLRIFCSKQGANAPQHIRAVDGKTGEAEFDGYSMAG